MLSSLLSRPKMQIAFVRMKRLPCSVNGVAPAHILSARHSRPKGLLKQLNPRVLMDISSTLAHISLQNLDLPSHRAPKMCAYHPTLPLVSPALAVALVSAE